jgi:serine/threonine protein phosphatase PrpC
MKHTKGNGEKTMKGLVESLLDDLIAPDTQTGLGCDNMTCIIVDLRRLKKSK